MDVVGGTSTEADDSDQQGLDVDSGKSHVPNVDRMQEPDKPPARSIGP